MDAPTPAATRPPLSVVVPTRDRPEFLRGCLRTVRASLGPDDELIVVDSASRLPGTADAGREFGATVVRAPVKGASLARNVGWRAARHDLIAFIDDDVRVAPEWAAAMAAALSLPGVDFVTGRLDVPPGQEGAERAVAQISEDAPRRIDDSNGAMAGHSANFGAHRDALEQVGGFDERLGPGHPYIAEDGDLFDRLVLAGRVGRFEPAAQGWHEQWRDRPALLKLDWHYGLGSGARLAKLVRLDRRRARMVGRVVVVDWCLQSLADNARARYRFGVADDLIRLAGVGAGFVATIGAPLRDGHLGRVRDLSRRPGGATARP